MLIEIDVVKYQCVFLFLLKFAKCSLALVSSLFNSQCLRNGANSSLQVTTLRVLYRFNEHPTPFFPGSYVLPEHFFAYGPMAQHLQVANLWWNNVSRDAGQWEVRIGWTGCRGSINDYFYNSCQCSVCSLLTLV